ncbi:ATP-dependent DNA ligase [Streptomonospora sp. NEAU-YY374]|nr:ATP-dependent DNA ligase [Streptomonospora nanhaiensis]
MLARTTDTLPEGERWRYEPKWDGWRALAERGGAGASLYSRSGSNLTLKFPEIVAAVRETLPAGTVVDGEIVRWSPEGRLDFDALLRRGRAGPATARRMAAAEPCHYVLFDVLRVEGDDLTGRPLDERRARLEALLGGVSERTLALSWHTVDLDEAMDWWSGLADVGVEGLMAKDGRAPYRPGRRDWLKYKRRVTTEAIVGGVTGRLGTPETLVLGRRDDRGDLRIAGRTVPLSRAQQRALAETGMLHAAEGGHPWPASLAPAWGSRERIRYIRVEPRLVVEVEPDVATLGGTRWRHAVRYVRPRPDRSPSGVPRGLAVE